MKIKKGDIVKIVSGNDRGKQGKVLAVFPKESKVVVDGLNMKKKHVRPRSQGKKGELIRLPAPLHVSRIMLLCSKCSKPTRVGYKINDLGIKSRVCLRCKGEI